MSVAESPTELPSWERVLAVVAHPDDESFGLGAVLDVFVRNGAQVAVLCLTQGEASTLHEGADDLATVRADELRSAALALGVQATELANHPDGALHTIDPAVLADDIDAAIARHHPDGLLVFDPSGISGHLDHVTATQVALRSAELADVPVLAWTLPKEVAEQLNREAGATFVGHDADEIDLVLPVARERQRAASLEHVSQAIPTSILWRRLELLGDREHLRWLHRPRAETAG